MIQRRRGGWNFPRALAIAILVGALQRALRLPFGRTQRPEGRAQLLEVDGAVAVEVVRGEGAPAMGGICEGDMREI